MSDYIERGALKDHIKDYAGMFTDELGFVVNLEAVLRGIDFQPAADVVEVKHGKWALETHSFYRDTFDESCELVVYITASCSECGCKHPNGYEVFSKTLYAPEGADEDFRFDQKAEEEKARAEFTQRNNVFFANYCPNCGAKMDGGADNG